MKHPRHYWIFLVLISSFALASGGTGIFLSASRLSFPLHDPDTGRLAAIVRVDEVRRDHQRKGFFKIGFMPIVRASNVSVEILDEELFLKNVSKFVTNLEAPESLPLEIRGLRLASHRGDWSFQAEVARTLAENAWELRGAQIGSPGVIQKIPRAHLTFAADGPQLRGASSNTYKLFPKNP